jgi:hypothetical protein
LETSWAETKCLLVRHTEISLPDTLTGLGGVSVQVDGICEVSSPTSTETGLVLNLSAGST